MTTTRYKQYTDVDKLPYGVNCIVAIASYSGYNQEDAVILNKSSVERGMFQTVYFRSYEDQEEITGNTRVYFDNPKYQSNVQNKNMKRFEKLDENGFIKENVHITPDDVFACKCVKQTTENGTKTSIKVMDMKDMVMKYYIREKLVNKLKHLFLWDPFIIKDLKLW